MLPRWQLFGNYLRPVFATSRAQHISDLHSKFALRPHHVWKYARHPIYDRWDYARKNKKQEEAEKKKNKEIIGRKHNGLPYYTYNFISPHKLNKNLTKDYTGWP